jgi:Leucine-rich repeat (LRR) protein
LNLNNNNLTNVRAFGVFTQLKILLLAQNQINSLDGLQSCENLEILNVAGNNLTG